MTILVESWGGGGGNVNKDFVFHLLLFPTLLLTLKF